jgi:hypothetical protein
MVGGDMFDHRANLVSREVVCPVDEDCVVELFRCWSPLGH